MKRIANLTFCEVDTTKSTVLTNRLVLIMAVACGIGIANLYYLQPLLAEMGHEFVVSAGQIGFVATLGQLGYAAGLILIVPLGDTSNQRALIVTMLCIATFFLAVMALAQTITLLAVASFAIGLTSIVPPLILPYVAKLAPVQRRGRSMGTVMSGLLVGILLARVVSGLVGMYFGWRAMYWIAAVLTFLFAVILRFLLPEDHLHRGDMTYLQLLSSLSKIVRNEPVLQELMTFGFLAFGAFSAFWAVLSFFLATPPYHYSSNIVGLFGLAGLTGVFIVSLVGKFADQRDARHINGVALTIALLSFIILWWSSQYIITLIIGVILLDVGIQANNVSCQTRMAHLNSAERSRLNAAYSIFYYLGGSIGTFLGTLAWNIAQWSGICSVACVMLVGALSFYVLHGKRIQQWKKHLVKKGNTFE